MLPEPVPSMPMLYFFFFYFFFFNDDPGLTLTIFMTGSNLFLMLLCGCQLSEHRVLLYVQVCSNSAYPQHSGEPYRTNGPLVYEVTYKFL